MPVPSPAMMLLILPETLSTTLMETGRSFCCVMSRALRMRLRRQACVVQRQNRALPVPRCEFDSRHPHHLPNQAAVLFAAHRFFIAILSALRPATVMPPFGLAVLAAFFAGAFAWTASPLIFAHLAC
jgi:hypothetical protein